MFTQQNGSNRVMLTLFMLFLVIILTSCVQEDWAYSDLPNDYEIWSFNSDDVTLVKDDRNHCDRVIDAFVLEFCFNESYIGLKCVCSKTPSQVHGMDIPKATSEDDPEYYLVDTDKDVIMGPYSEEEYRKLLDTLDNWDMSEWIGTRPRPEGSWQ